MNAVVVWIVIAALCVKLAQGRDRNSPPLTTHSHSLRADADFHVSITPHMQHDRKNNEDVVFLLVYFESNKNRNPCTPGVHASVLTTTTEEECLLASGAVTLSVH